MGSYSNVIVCLSQSKGDQMRDGCVRGAEIACLTCACGVLQLPVGLFAADFSAKALGGLELPYLHGPGHDILPEVAGLFLMDCCTSAFHRSHHPDPWTGLHHQHAQLAPDFFCYVTGWIGVAISLCMRPHHPTLTLDVARSHVYFPPTVAA